VTGLLPDSYPTDGDNTDDEYDNETLPLQHTTDWEHVFLAHKVRVVHTERNPTNAMIRNEVSLRDKWQQSNSKEFDGMTGSGLLKRIPRDEALRVG